MLHRTARLAGSRVRLDGRNSNCKLPTFSELFILVRVFMTIEDDICRRSAKRVYILGKSICGDERK